MVECALGRHGAEPTDLPALTDLSIKMDKRKGQLVEEFTR